MSEPPRFGAWTPVGEALPELSEANRYGVTVLAADGHGNVRTMRYARNMYAKLERNRSPRWKESSGRLAWTVPVAWMPLPPPPGREEAADG